MQTMALVEDDPTARELLILSLRQSKKLKVAALYGTATDALRDLPRIKPDIVVMDIKLPGMDGIACVRALRNLSPPFDSHILMLSEHDDADLIFDALKAGADGYLLKRHTSAKDLEAAARDVLAGGAVVSPGVARKIFDYFKMPPSAQASAKAPCSEPLAPLTSREQEVLSLLMTGLMYKEMAEHLSVSIHAIRKHLQSIYQKLHVRSRADPLSQDLAGHHRTTPPPA